MEKTIVLCDNQEITKAGILFVCEAIPVRGKVLEASSRNDLVNILTQNPDSVVILDYSLFDLKSIEELFIINERFRKVQWILFSEYLSEDFIRRVAFESEDFGIILKDSSLEEIRLCIQKALDSERYISSRISNMLLNSKAELSLKEQPVLTATEKEILKAMALGKTTKEIAAERFSSVHTIITHRKNIFRKLEVNNVHEATKYALRAGVVDSAEYYI